MQWVRNQTILGEAGMKKSAISVICSTMCRLEGSKGSGFQQPEHIRYTPPLIRHTESGLLVTEYLACGRVHTLPHYIRLHPQR